jgi:hypothetical protein
MPAKDPNNYSFLAYLVVTGISLFGGVSGYLRKIQRGLTKKFSVFELITEAFISVFVGFSAFYLCELNEMDSNATRAIVLITSHFSTKAIYILEFLMDRQAERIGIKPTKPIKSTKGDKDE